MHTVGVTDCQTDCRMNAAIQFYAKEMPINHFRIVDDQWGGRCVVCASDVDSNQIVLQVPLRLIMTSALAKASPIGLSLSATETYLNNSEHLHLSLFLLAEKSKVESFWHAYIKLLPSHFDWMPMFYTDSDLDLLTGSFTRDIALHRKIKYRREFLVLSRCNFQIGFLSIAVALLGTSFLQFAAAMTFFFGLASVLLHVFIFLISLQKNFKAHLV